LSRHIEELTARELRIDHHVQRSDPPAGAVNALINNWKRDATGVLTASHRDDGAYYVLDGQTRVAAALKCDPEFRFVVQVHEGLSVAEEIDLFEYHNKNRRQVSAIDLLRLRVNRGREPYATLGIQLARRKLTLGNAGRGGSPTIIGSARPLEWLLEQPRGSRRIAPLLDVVMAAYPSEETRWRGIFLGGVAYVLVIADRGHAEVNYDRLAKILQRNLPRHWEMKVRDKRETAGSANLWVAVGQLMIELYNKRLVKKNQLPTPWLDPSGPAEDEE
jgi:hypothetical protein